MADQDAVKALEGRDGFLFLTNDTNRVIDQIEGRYQLDDRFLWSIAMTHAARRAFCAMIGADYHHFVVPDRETVLARFLPDSVVPERDGLRPLLQYRASGADELHEVHYDTASLDDGGDETCFPRRDTHWTFEGACRYVRFMGDLLGLDPSFLDLTDAKEHVYDNPGDLGGKLGLPPIKASLMIPAHPAVRPVYDNRLLNVGRIRITANPEKDAGERWIVLHDSFGEIPTLLLAPCAATILFIHTVDFDEIFVRRFQPSRVIMLQIERFFVRCPMNGVDWFALVEHQHRAKRESGQAETELPPLPDDLVTG
jgi:alginate O-acetyltransferase complex protein AlgJ